MLQAILGLDKAKRLQEARDGVMRDAIGPRLRYLETEEAIGQLLRTNQLSADEASRAYLEASIAFYSSREDAVSGQMLGRLQIMKDLRDEAGPMANAMRSIWADQAGPMRTYQTALQAVIALERDHLITSQQAARASRDAAISYLDTQQDAASGVTRALLRIGRAAEDVASQMEQALTTAFKGAEDLFVELTRSNNSSDRQQGKSVAQVRREKLRSSAEGALDKIQEDLLRSTFQTTFGGPLAGLLGGALGLGGKIGETRSNPLWVRMADSAASLNAGLATTAEGLATITGGESLPSTFGTFTQRMGGTLDKGATNFGNVLVNSASLFGMALRQVTGSKTASTLMTVVNGGLQIANAYGAFGGSGGGAYGIPGSDGMYATGGSFTVGGSGGVDSQLVSFRASPGERVSVDRAGQSRQGNEGGNSFYFDIDARGADANVDARIEAALRRAEPMLTKKAREASAKDRAYEKTRERK
jgi:hypothetical protein